MLDRKYIIDSQEDVKVALRNRNSDEYLVNKFIEVDSKKSVVQRQLEDLKAEQNKIAREFGQTKSEELRQKAVDLKQKVKSVQDEYDELTNQSRLIQEQIPNVPASDVPVGKDDSENQLFREWGKPREFDFPVLDHVDLGEKLGILDIKTAAKVSGARFGYFKGQGAVLEMAVMFMVFKKLTEKGFAGMIPPAMVRAETEWKMGYTSNANLTNAYYHFPVDDLIFISSSEHSVVPYHMDEILAPKSLPIKYVNFSPCFRREAGTYGKDMRGLFRVHFFNKVEMNVFTMPDYKVSDEMCLELLAIEEEIMQSLEIPYQVVKCCTGDLPQPNRRMYDVNSWFPGQNKFRETQSCSNCGDYQARRLNTQTIVDGKKTFVHILNATVITDRAVLAIMENHQQADGSIKIPEVLVPFTGFDKIAI